MADIEYYNSAQADPEVIGGTLRAYLDGLIGQLLEIEHASVSLQFLFKYFGPTDTADNINKVISRDGDFVYLDGVKIVAESVGQAAIPDVAAAALSAGKSEGAVVIVRR